MSNITITTFNQDTSHSWQFTSLDTVYRTLEPGRCIKDGYVNLYVNDAHCTTTRENMAILAGALDGLYLG